MAKVEKVEKKDQKSEKTVSKVKKSSYSKKKKIKKNILNGIAYVQSTFNNTIISIADTNGNVVSWASAGQKGFKGSRKSTPYAAQIAADAAASKALEFGMKTLSVEVKGPGSGRAKITQITRYGTVLLATVQGYGLSVGLESSANLVINPGIFFKISTVTTIVAGTIFLMWLGEQITQRGIGNGISLIIFAGIVAEIPRALVTTFELGRTGAISTLMIIAIFILLILTILFIVFMERALRKILINYPKRQMGNKMYGGESSHLPLKINQAGVIPAIFASALLLLPVTFSNFDVSDNETFLNLSSYFTQGQPLYMLLYASGIIFFTFFYTSITFNPTETADNLRKYGGFVPGIRPGESTALYIENILTKLTTIGALYLTLVCLMPEFLIANYPIPFYLGGTSILIVVVVAIDTVTQVQTRLMSSQYEQLIKKTKFGR